MKKNKDKYSTTYLITGGKPSLFPDQLFINIIHIKQLDIEENGKITIIGNCSNQSFIIAPSEFVGSYDLTIRIKTNFSKEKIIDKLKSKQIEKSNWH